jgi:hypothetical protein
MGHPGSLKGFRDPVWISRDLLCLVGPRMGQPGSLMACGIPYGSAGISYGLRDPVWVIWDHARLCGTLCAECGYYLGLEVYCKGHMWDSARWITLSF